MKRIIILADGTWNSPESNDDTNVVQLARAIKTESNHVKQVVFYDWGVGTDRKKLSGGISGDGIDKNIKDCYRFIVHNYEKGDELFFFGFSRGAFTVRSLGGLIRNFGIIKSKYAHMIPDAYKLYRKRGKSTHPDNEKSKEFRSKYAIEDISKIKFIGVWDTVGALGVPLPFWGTLGEDNALFHDLRLSSTVEYARHAVSIDENRIDFEPTLWEGNGISDLKQVWFSGIHSNIGGGYKENGLSDHSLDWMVSEAKAIGLEVDAYLMNQITPNYKDKMHNERKGVYYLRSSFIRNIEGTLHNSVKRRWDENIDNYQKKSKALEKLLDSVDNDWSKVDMV